MDSTGRASQVLNQKFTVPCEVGVLTFPFDKHKCHVKFSQLYNEGMRSDLTMNLKHLIEH